MTLKEKTELLIEKFVNKETLLYVTFGVLTTLVNYAVFFSLRYAWMPKDGSFLYLVINAIAWFVSFIFAYVTNKIFVFHSKGLDKKSQLREIASFSGARLLSLGFEQLGILIFINWMKFNGAIVKLALGVFVVLINYFLSKFIIFKKEEA